MYSHLVSCKATYAVVMHEHTGFYIAYGYKDLNINTSKRTNLSLILTLLEFKHGKQYVFIVAQLIERTVVNY